MKISLTYLLVSDHSISGCVSYSGIDKDTGELVDIGEWIFCANNKNDAISIQKQICSIEQEMTYLLKLKHSNLGHYYGIKYHMDENSVTVNLLREFIHGKFQLFNHPHH